VAIKVIDKQKFMQKAKRKDSLMDEVRVLQSVSHPNILQIKGVFETPSTLYLVLELATGGELFDRIVKGAQPEPTACEIFYQMLLAIKYLHAQGIAHRDLKPENISLRKRGKRSRILDNNALKTDIAIVREFKHN
jgi:serine/threonine protein kinase